MANTYSSPGTYRAPGVRRQRQPGEMSTGQEAFSPGGSADPEKINKGFLTGETKAPANWRPVSPVQGTPDDPLKHAYTQSPKPQPANDSVSYQGQAQGQTTTPAPQKPVWNPQGDASTWGNQYNQFLQQQNEYTNRMNTGKTSEQAQAEIDAWSRAGAPPPRAALKGMAGGGPPGEKGAHPLAVGAPATIQGIYL